MLPDAPDKRPRQGRRAWDRMFRQAPRRTEFCLEINLVILLATGLCFEFLLFVLFWVLCLKSFWTCLNVRHVGLSKTLHAHTNAEGRNAHTESHPHACLSSAAEELKHGTVGATYACVFVKKEIYHPRTQLQTQFIHTTCTEANARHPTRAHQRTAATGASASGFSLLLARSTAHSSSIRLIRSRRILGRCLSLCCRSGDCGGLARGRLRLG